MTLEHDIELLRRIPFFAEVPAEPLKLLAFSAEAQDLRDGTVLFAKGAPADGGYVVMSGEIDLVGDGHRVLARVGPGTLLGEISLVVETERPATAVAAGQARVIGIRRSTFRRVLEEYPGVADALQAYFAQRLSEIGPGIAAAADAMARIDGD